MKEFSGITTKAALFLFGSWRGLFCVGSALILLAALAVPIAPWLEIPLVVCTVLCVWLYSWSLCRAGAAVLAIFLAVGVLSGCSKSPAVSTSNQQPAVTDVAGYASAWIAGLTETLVENGPEAVDRLCKAGVLDSEDCALAQLGVGLGSLVLPAIVNSAQKALGAYETSPTAASEAALAVAMAPVYDAAKAANTQ